MPPKIKMFFKNDKNKGFSGKSRIPILEQKEKTNILHQIWLMPPWLNVDYSNRSHVFLQKLTLKLGVIWNFQQDTFNKTQQKVFTLINRTIWILRNKTFWNFQHTMTDVSFHQYINSADEIRQQRLKSITGTKRQNSKLVFRLDFFFNNCNVISIGNFKKNQKLGAIFKQTENV